MTRPTRALIDIRALQSNFDCVRQTAPVSRIMAVLKADAYGHGGVRVARALDKADAFGVASLEEAVELREAGIRHRILLLQGFYNEEELDLIVHHGLEVVIHDLWQLEVVERKRLTPLLRVWLKVDSGMHRLGVAPDQVPKAVDRLKRAGSVKKPFAFMSHLSCADELDNERTREQQKRFLEAVSEFSGERSLANSAGILGWPETHMDWVRPGIMLYGASPFRGAIPLGDPLKPVMQLTTRLIAVQQRRTGEPIGYGAEWKCPEDMPVGIAAIGYGDGYPRHAPPGTPVLVNGVRVPLVGRVCMDMIAVDLRPVPNAKVADSVMLWGPGLPVDEIAEQAGTIAYELLCGVSKRVSFDTRG